MIKIFLNKADDEIVVNISGDIGAGFFSDGITLDSVMQQIKDSTAGTIIMNLSSMGGDLMEGLGIHDYLKLIDKKKVCNILSSTASAGTVIAMAAEEIYIAPNARFLIHQASTFGQGNADDLKQQAADLESYDNTIVNLYTAKTGKDEEFIRNLMKQNRWMTAQESVDNGFCTGILTKISNKSKINNMDEEQVKTLQSENEALKAQIAELNAKLAELQGKQDETEKEMIDAEIDAAVEAGKITDAEKEVYQNYGKGNVKALREKLKAIEPKKVAFNVNNVTEPVGKLSWRELTRKNPKLLADLKERDKKTFNSIYREEFGVDYKF